MYILVFMLFLVLFVVIVIASVLSANKKSEEMMLDISSSPTHEYQEEKNIQRPKISAEISPALNDKIRLYCFENSITISDLIRRSVNDYIDNH